MIPSYHPNPKESVQMHLILHYLKRYKIYVFFNLLAILGFATAELGIPTIVSRMIDNGIILNDRAYIYKMAAAILAVAVAGGIETCCWPIAFPVSSRVTGISAMISLARPRSFPTRVQQVRHIQHDNKDHQ